ncbi:MAG: hypothetical protein ABIA63_15385, partial [bacterium]
SFLARNKPVLVVFIILASPFALAWAFIYGLIIGIIGPTVDIYEIIKNRTYNDVRTVLKYPRWRAKVHKILSLKSAQDEKGRIPEEERKRIEKSKPPGVFGYIFQNTFVFGIVYYPFLLIWGIITGPIRAFLECYKWCYTIWAGHSIYRDM